MTIKVYVAGCFDAFSEIRNIQDFVLSKGYEISYDWTLRAEDTLKKRDLVDKRTPEIMAEEATLDMNGVMNADVTVFYINKPEYVYRGTFCELGASLARDRMRNLGKRTIVLSPMGVEMYAKSLCFYHHLDIIHVNTVEELANKLEQYK
jgi:hypothetical protein